MGVRLTTIVNGKRIYKIESTLKREIRRQETNILRNKVRNTERTIKMCKGVVNILTKYSPRALQKQPSIAVTRRPTPPPPPSMPMRRPQPPPPSMPTRKPVNLMNALRANIRRRGLMERSNNGAITTVA